LLRVLETREVLRVGSVSGTRVDVRFISATNEPLDALVARGAFRRDLYFRLAGMTLQVPSLRARRGEIPQLAAAFVREFAERAGRTPAEFSREALALLCRYDWPGNIRELRNVCERAVVLSRGGQIRPEHLQLPNAPTVEIEPESGGLVPRAVIAELERQRLVETLEKTNGNQTQAARVLGISRRTLINRLDEFGLARPRKPRG
jgi:DNA-binding NtrC family response regulator